MPQQNSPRNKGSMPRHRILYNQGVFFFLCLFSASFPMPVKACTCTGEFEEYTSRTDFDLIFYGIPLEETEMAHSMHISRFSSQKVVKLSDRAKTVLNGESTITLLQPLSECASIFEKGKSYIIHAAVTENDSGTEYLTTSQCFGTGRIFSKEDAITEEQFKKLLMDAVESEKPDARISLLVTEEKGLVPGLFEKLGVQIFSVKTSANPEPVRYFYADNTIDAIPSFGGQGLMSAVLVSRKDIPHLSLYYTFSFGSGIHRSHIGHIYRDGNGAMVKIDSEGFQGMDLFASVDEEGKTHIHSGDYKAFNKWTPDDKSHFIIDPSERSFIKLTPVNISQKNNAQKN